MLGTYVFGIVLVIRTKRLSSGDLLSRGKSDRSRLLAMATADLVLDDRHVGSSSTSCRHADMLRLLDLQVIDGKVKRNDATCHATYTKAFRETTGSRYVQLWFVHPLGLTILS